MTTKIKAIIETKTTTDQRETIVEGTIKTKTIMKVIYKSKIKIKRVKKERLTNLKPQDKPEFSEK
jgi:hypothetical protein